MDPKIVKKPWGREIWFAQTKDYMGKVLIIEPGQQVSLHRHNKKEETMLVFSGEVKVEGDKIGAIARKFGQGLIIHVFPDFNHSMKCVSEVPAVLFEVSTSFPDDSIRIKDYYGREVNG